MDDAGNVVRNTQDGFRSCALEAVLPNFTEPYPYTFIFYGKDSCIMFPGIIGIVKFESFAYYEMRTNERIPNLQLLEFSETDRTYIARRDGRINFNKIDHVKEHFDCLDDYVGKDTIETYGQSFKVLEEINPKSKYVIFDRIYQRNELGFYNLLSQTARFTMYQ